MNAKHVLAVLVRALDAIADQDLGFAVQLLEDLLDELEELA
jgi:hypothetical protein